MAWQQRLDDGCSRDGLVGDLGVDRSIDLFYRPVFFDALNHKVPWNAGSPLQHMPS